MAPLDSLYADAAVSRTELLTQFCGRNALISVDRLIGLELAKLAGYDAAAGDFCGERLFIEVAEVLHAQPFKGNEDVVESAIEQLDGCWVRGWQQP